VVGIPASIVTNRKPSIAARAKGCVQWAVWLSNSTNVLSIVFCIDRSLSSITARVLAWGFGALIVGVGLVVHSSSTETEAEQRPNQSPHWSQTLPPELLEILSWFEYWVLAQTWDYPKHWFIPS
jgi:hypothetical protein